MNPNAKLFDQAMNTITADRLDALIETLERDHAAIKRPVGGSIANFGAMRIAASSEAAIVELITNGMDSQIEQAGLVAKVQLGSIAEGAQLAGVAEGGLDRMTPTQRRHLAEGIVVSLLDSDESKGMPTLDVRDFGTGVTRDEYVDTLGSLHRANKLRAAHQHGQFGQGAQQSWPFTKNGGLIIARASEQRRANSFSSQDEIMIVPHRWEKSSDDAKQPTLYFWVASDGMPVAIPAQDLDFEPGVLRRLINYNIGYGARVSTQSEKSTLAHLQSLLVAPTMPWKYKDARTGSANCDNYESHKNGQTMSGLRIKLNESRSLETDRRFVERVEVDEIGTIDIELFTVEDVDQLRRARAYGHTVMLSVNGQTHARLTNADLRDQCSNLKRAFDHMVAIIDCTNINERGMVFSSSRDRLDQGELGQRVTKRICEALDNSEPLLALERELEAKALEKARENATKTSKEMLEHFLAQLDTDYSAIGLGHKLHIERPQRELSAYPQELTGPSRLVLAAGQKRVSRSWLTLARDHFVPSEGEISVEFAGDEPEGFSFHAGAHLNGRLSVVFSADEDVEPGVHAAKLVLSWADEKLEADLAIELVANAVEDDDDEDAGDDPAADKPDGAPVLLIRDNSYDGFADDVAGDFKRMSASLVALEDDNYAYLADVEGEVDVVLINSDFAPFKGYVEALAQAGKDSRVQSRVSDYAVMFGSQLAVAGMRERHLRETGEEGMSLDQLQRAYSDMAYTAVRSFAVCDNVQVGAKVKRSKRSRSGASTLVGAAGEQARDEQGRFA